ncbi:hypothetical protein VTH06DRAFT_5637 [Thermothelomyces fergusii]
MDIFYLIWCFHQPSVSHRGLELWRSSVPSFITFLWDGPGIKSIVSFHVKTTECQASHGKIEIKITFSWKMRLEDNRFCSLLKARLERGRVLQETNTE